MEADRWEGRLNRRTSGCTWEVNCANRKSRLSHPWSRGNGGKEVWGGRMGALKVAEGMGPGREDRDRGINQDLHRALAHTDALGSHPQTLPWEGRGDTQGT